MPSLKIEMARGEGENLKAFSQIMGCNDSAQFSQMAKAKYQDIFPTQDTGAQQLIFNLKTQIQTNPSLRQNCSSVASL